MVASPSQQLRRPRGRCPGIPVRIAEGADGQDLLGASLALAQTQIAGQVAEEASLDSRLMGILGFAGALVGTDVAIRELLGTCWWIPLIPLGLAALVCLSAVRNVRLVPTDLGPEPGVFYSTYSGSPRLLAHQQLLAELVVAITRNARRVDAKRHAVRFSTVILTVGLTTSAVPLWFL
jgi:hypothetical protein